MILMALEFTESPHTHEEEHLLGLTLRDKLLSLYVPDSEGLSFGKGERGKPYVVGSHITYSVSHTEGCTACAVSIPHLKPDSDIALLPDKITENGIYLIDTYNEPCELGIDVERLATERDEARLSAIGKRYFDSGEIALLNVAKDVFAEFYRIWTGKESMVKCTGEGLSALSFADTDLAVNMGFSLREFTLENGRYRFSGSVCRNNELLDL